MLFAEYVPPNNKTSGLEMPNRRGLDAALRAKLIDLAECRQMIGPPKKSTIEIEDESDESKPHPLGTRKRSRRVAVKGRLKRNN